MNGQHVLEQLAGQQKFNPDSSDLYPLSFQPSFFLAIPVISSARWLSRRVIAFFALLIWRTYARNNVNRDDARKSLFPRSFCRASRFYGSSFTVPSYVRREREGESALSRTIMSSREDTRWRYLPPRPGSAQLKRDVVSHRGVFARVSLGARAFRWNFRGDGTRDSFTLSRRAGIIPACEIDKISGILNQITRERDFNCSNRPDCFISSCNRRRDVYSPPLPLSESRIHYFLIVLPRIAPLSRRKKKTGKVREGRNFGQVEFQSLVSAEGRNFSKFIR